MYKICSIGSERLVVWDPITGGQKKLSVPKKYPPIYYAGAVLCAVDSCDHLDCHAGAYRVVCCGARQYKIWVIMYSSETREWSSMISIDVDNDVHLSCSTLIGNALYFSLECAVSMLKYDLGRHKLSVISSPGVSEAVAMELDQIAGGPIRSRPLTRIARRKVYSQACGRPLSCKLCRQIFRGLRETRYNQRLYIQYLHEHNSLNE
jgi:hypothetical protein